MLNDAFLLRIVLGSYLPNVRSSFARSRKISPVTIPSETVSQAVPIVARRYFHANPRSIHVRSDSFSPDGDMNFAIMPSCFAIICRRRLANSRSACSMESPFPWRSSNSVFMRTILFWSSAADSPTMS